MKLLARLTGGAMAAIALTATAALADWPERPITIVVPWGAGGGADFHARALAPHLEAALGQPVNVVNRTGGNGVTGHAAVAGADPDGYTLGILTVEVAMMHWQGLTDIAPADYDVLGLLNFISPSVNVAADAPYQTAEDLVAAIRENPGELRGSGSPVGAIWHVAFLAMLAKADLPADAIRWIPSQGGAPGLQELLAGGVDVAPVNIGEAGALIKAGEVRSLMIMSDTRNATFPDVPTMEEALGLSGAPQALVAIAGPDGLPADVRATLTAAVAEATASEAWATAMNDRGFGTSDMGVEAFSAYLAELDTLMGAVLEDAGLTQ